jgi:hypothetical protein
MSPHERGPGPITVGVGAAAISPSNSNQSRPQLRIPPQTRARCHSWKRPSSVRGDSHLDGQAISRAWGGEPEPIGERPPPHHDDQVNEAALIGDRIREECAHLTRAVNPARALPRPCKG